MYMVIYQIKEREIYDQKDGSSNWITRESFFMHKEAAIERVSKEKRGVPEGMTFHDIGEGFEVYDKSGRLVFEISLITQTMATLMSYEMKGY